MSTTHDNGDIFNKRSESNLESHVIMRCASTVGVKKKNNFKAAAATSIFMEQLWGIGIGRYKILRHHHRRRRPR